MDLRAFNFLGIPLGHGTVASMSDYDDISERIQLASRSDSHGFAQRTLKNLEYIEKRRKAGDDVHVVTQRVLSLLGLVACPWERAWMNP